VEQVTAVVDEAIRETIGTSSKKWALVVVALVVGAVGALLLVRRARTAESTLAPVDVDTT
jgi:hypothetical protein